MILAHANNKIRPWFWFFAYLSLLAMVLVSLVLFLLIDIPWITRGHIAVVEICIIAAVFLGFLFHGLGPMLYFVTNGQNNVWEVHDGIVIKVQSPRRYWCYWKYSKYLMVLQRKTTITWIMTYPKTKMTVTIKFPKDNINTDMAQIYYDWEQGLWQVRSTFSDVVDYIDRTRPDQPFKITSTLP